MICEENIEDIIIDALNDNDKILDITRYKDSGICEGYFIFKIEMSNGSEFIVEIRTG